MIGFGVGGRTINNLQALHYFAIIALLMTLACILIVIVIDYTSYPQRMVPDVLITLLSTIIGYCGSILGSKLTQLPPPNS